MAKGQRSPLLGYNHNVGHLGRVFHVQTEDSGPISPRLFTHLFYEGTILESRRHDYAPDLTEDKVRALMKAQHKSVIRDLLRAQFDQKIIAFFRARGEELSSEHGAMPTEPMADSTGPDALTSGVLPASIAGGSDLSDMDRALLATARPLATGDAPATNAAAAAEPAAPAADIDDGGVPIPVDPVRTVTRPMVSTSRAGGRDGRRPPFVRSGQPNAVRTSSADGVVVQRNVVVGAPQGGGRPARIRPAVPYVVGGGGAPARGTGAAPAAANDAPARGRAADAAARSGAAGSAPAASGTPGPSVPASAASRSSSSSSRSPSSSSSSSAAVDPAAVTSPMPSVSSARPTGSGFGSALRDDKSLDEVILEYLAEDGES